MRILNVLVLNTFFRCSGLSGFFFWGGAVWEQVLIKFFQPPQRWPAVLCVAGGSLAQPCSPQWLLVYFLPWVMCDLGFWGRSSSPFDLYVQGTSSFQKLSISRIKSVFITVQCEVETERSEKEVLQRKFIQKSFPMTLWLDGTHQIPLIIRNSCCCCVVTVVSIHTLV